MKNLRIVCNWKMNPASQKEAATLAREIARASNSKKGEVVIAPPAIYLSTVKNEHANVALQDVSEYSNGAHTGSISASMAKNMGVSYVIVGHSERRREQHETGTQIAQKIERVYEAKLIPIVCVGELKKETPARAWNKVKKQLDEIIPSFKKGKGIIAYEPVWAIGGDKKTDSAYAHEMMYRIKLYMRMQAQLITPILYGGSVNCKNIEDFLEYKDSIDGFLVGSASAQKKEITTLIKKIYGSY